MLVHFKTKNNGVCLTPCPHGVECSVNSVVCTLCPFYFGTEGDAVKCTGDRLKNEEI